MDLAECAGDRAGPLRARGRRADGSTSATPPPTAGCCAIPGSGPGRCSAWATTVAASPTRCRPGDLAYVKLVGALAGLGRRATVEEVEEFFAPYAPFRGLAGSFALARWHGAVAAGPAAAPRRLTRHGS